MPRSTALNARNDPETSVKEDPNRARGAKVLIRIFAAFVGRLRQAVEARDMRTRSWR